MELCLYFWFRVGLLEILQDYTCTPMNGGSSSSNFGSLSRAELFEH